ncbi:MAG TPA: hypothetical protein VH040_00455 [Usitatibacter sp.]|nr:hypothetical protein [Usitatibacter sp.]
MNAGGRTRASLAVVAIVSACFAAAAHFALLDDLPPALGAVLSLLPVLLLAAWAARRSRRAWLPASVVIAIAAGAWLERSALLRLFPHLFFLEHAGANLVLGMLFGRTLLPGHEPLCTSFARLLHGALPEPVLRYTRAVTAAWTLFFASIFTLSCGLYLSHQLAAWSFLANIVSPVLLVAMFPIEYAVRHRVLPDWERVGVMGSIQAFSRYFAAPQAGTPR